MDIEKGMPGLNFGILFFNRDQAAKGKQRLYLCY
jgi:hypothetical protein